MTDADRRLLTILEAGDIVGWDDAGRTVVQLAVDRADFDSLMAFGADAVEGEDGGNDDLGQVLPQSVYWFWEAAPVLPGSRYNLDS